MHSGVQASGGGAAPRYRVLLLGEGNFSFSLALCRWLDCSSSSSSSSNPTAPPHSVVATSFDSHEQVLSKYPESSSTLANLQKCSCTTLHNIDATRPLLSQLALPLSHLPSAAPQCIIFNFPHLGIEDAKMHSSMLAHAMSCVGDALAHSSSSLPSSPCGSETAGDDSESPSVFILTLANAQAERWRMAEMAERNNLQLVDVVPFRDSDWPGYEIKRHVSGKSFKRRVSDCSYFVFVRRNESKTLADIKAGVAAGGFGPIHAHLRQLRRQQPPDNAGYGHTEEDARKRKQPDQPEQTEQHNQLDAYNSSPTMTSVAAPIISGAAAAAAVPAAPAALQEAADNNKKRKSKRVFITATDGQFAERNDCDSIQGGGGGGGGGGCGGGRVFECLVCKRAFNSEHSTRTHIYSLHVLQQASKGETGAASATAAAAASDAATTESDANATTNVTTVGVGVGVDAISKSCALCQRQFDTQHALQQHKRSVHGKFAPEKPAWAAASLQGALLSLPPNSPLSDATEITNVLPLSTSKCQAADTLDTEGIKGEAVGECGVCGMSSCSGVFQPRQQASLPRFPCEVCSRVFTDQRSLRQHANSCYPSALPPTSS